MPFLQYCTFDIKDLFRLQTHAVLLSYFLEKSAYRSLNPRNFSEKMKLPLSWIKEYIELPHSAEEISDILTMAGLEVDAIEQAPLPYEKVVVGKVLETRQHPEADKLCIATVSDGSDEFQVVCGAPNCRPGLITAFAKIGAKLTSGEKPFKIKKNKLRGVESMGMLCSEMELGFSEEAEGIIEFPETYVEGTDLHDIYGDIILEISLTPNLGHCASILGVSRELSAATGIPLRDNILHTLKSKHALGDESSTAINDIASISVQNTEHCPRYTCRVVKDLKVAPSPTWLRNRIESCGMRTVNNVVDITNLVLMEFGHPLHAFDYDKLEGHGIIVRSAVEGEKFQTLDDEHHTLNKEALLICDHEKPIALAGVMGGLNSEVGDLTKNILLESAYFQPSNIRKTSKITVQSEASKRFERGTDPNNALLALHKAADLMRELAGGTVVGGFIDVKEISFENWKVQCRYTRINSVLGLQLALGEVEEIFKRLELSYEFDGDDTFTVSVPTYRNDIHEEVDLIEEVVRIYGYDNVEIKPAHYQSSPLPHTALFPFEKKIRSQLVSEGLQEFLTCDLISPRQIETIKGNGIDPDSIIKVLNPTSVEQSVLRPSLLSGLLQVVRYNHDHKNFEISGFEIGKIHFKTEEGYMEQTMAGIILSGKTCPHNWSSKDEEIDFYDLKGIVENQFSSLGITNYTFDKSSMEVFHPGRQAAIHIQDTIVGSIGELHPAILRKLDIDQRVFFCTLNLHELHSFQKTEQKMEEIPVFPGSDRDWTITMKDETSMENVFSALSSIPSKLLQNVTLRDIYRSEQLGEGLKNVTLRFVYRDNRKTVSQNSVEAEHARITEKVLASLGEHVLRHNPVS
ncbi:MAG: phenylalanyl-tRNA synthetase beta chain [Chlamydiales bacterium]